MVSLSPLQVCASAHCSLRPRPTLMAAIHPAEDALRGAPDYYSTKNPWALDSRKRSHKPRLDLEEAVNYAGEAPSMWSFFYSFPNLIFKCHGSVLPKIWLEVPPPSPPPPLTPTTLTAATISATALTAALTAAHLRHPRHRLPQVVAAAACGIAAVVLNDRLEYDKGDRALGIQGHSIAGVSLAFLTVFRSQAQYLPISPYISIHLRTSPYIFLFLPIAP